MLAKTEPLNIKVLREHKQALIALATLEGETVSVVLRRLIRQAALDRGVWPSVSTKSDQRIVDAEH